MKELKMTILNRETINPTMGDQHWDIIKQGN